MAKKYGVIDIGTNSMRLLLAEVENGKILHRTKEINTTRIGASVDRQGIISEEGIKRNIEAFQDFINKARQYGAENIWAIATSAVRDAKNGGEFTRLAYEKTGVPIEIISGEKEAQLGYKGVLMSLHESGTGKILVIDIGGGSTEFILGSSNLLEEVISENVGAVRMTERIIHTDPVAPFEYEKLCAEIYEIIENTLGKLKESDIFKLIGIGGTITTVAAVHQQLEPYDMNKVHGHLLTLDQIHKLQEKLLSLTLEERRKVKGLHPKRADIIIAGIAILLTTMEKLGIKDLTVSEYDNLEGLLGEKGLIL